MHLEVCMSNVISDPVGLLETFTFTCLYFFLMSISIYYSDKKNVLKPQERKRGIVRTTVTLKGKENNHTQPFPVPTPAKRVIPS